MLWQEGRFLQGNWSSPIGLIPPGIADEQLEAWLSDIKMLAGELRGASSLDAAATSALALWSYAALATLSHQDFAVSMKAHSEV